MNFRVLVVAAVLATVGATHLACGPKDGSPSSLVRSYRGPGLQDSITLLPGAWWILTLDYRESRFFGVVDDSGALFAWTGTVEGLSAPGSLKLIVDQCIELSGAVVDSTCFAGKEIYGYEAPEALLQLSDPRDLRRPMTLIAPGDCTQLSAPRVRFVHSVFDDVADPELARMIGELNVVAPASESAAGAISGTTYLFGSSGSLVSPTPLPTPTEALSCVGGELRSTNFPHLVGNPDTGLYAGTRGAFPTEGWIGFANADSVASSQLVGQRMIGFDYQKNAPGTVRCPSHFPLHPGGMGAFRISVTSSSQLFITAVCDLRSYEAVSSSEDGSGSFRISSPGQIDVSVGSTTYTMHGFVQSIGGRFVISGLDRNPDRPTEPTPTPTPRADYRLIIGDWADEE